MTAPKPVQTELFGDHKGGAMRTRIEDQPLEEWQGVAQARRDAEVSERLSIFRQFVRANPSACCKRCGVILSERMTGRVLTETKAVCGGCNSAMVANCEVRP